MRGALVMESPMFSMTATAVVAHQSVIAALSASLR